jgi:hypothetical protein
MIGDTTERVENDLLPSASADRKKVPIATGVIDYFPLAIAKVAELSYVGNQKHNPNQPLHWNRPLSNDHSDCLMRHFVDRGRTDSDGIPHSAKVAWRALAILQLELENPRGAPERDTTAAAPVRAPNSGLDSRDGGQDCACPGNVCYRPGIGMGCPRK